jgi:hypothetical protein
MKDTPIQILDHIYYRDEASSETNKFRIASIDSATINPKETFIIYSNIGGGGGEESFPFKKIRIKKNNDSIVLKNKSEINSKFNQNRKKRLFSTSYTIIVN